MKEKILSSIRELDELDHRMAHSHLDAAQLADAARERKRLEAIVEKGREWIKLSDELIALDEIIQSKDASLSEWAKTDRPGVQQRFDITTNELGRLMRPPDPLANRNTIMEIRAGAGGDEAGLFVADLYRMYARFAQRQGLSTEIYSSSPTGIGGLKEIIFMVTGPNAYGWFRYEQGVHRVQRVPKTEAQGRVHTSTVTVAVLPEPTDVEVKIDVKDLRIDTYRSSGAGGQHVNKTESAIRITHIPTGVVVACQEERSQGQNKLRAMALLRAKLQETAEEKQMSEHRELRRRQIGTGDRSEKIRTYNFPQDRITDHRINANFHNIEGVLAGDMDEMVKALLDKADALTEDSPPL